MSDNLHENIKSITADILKLADSDKEPTDNLYENIKLINTYLSKFVQEYSNTGSGNVADIKIIDGNGGDDN